MKQFFTKNGVVKAFSVENNKVIATIKIGEVWVSNPTLKVFRGDGWEDYIPPTPEPALPTKEELVEEKIRERYSVNQEFEVLRKRDVDTEAFREYYAYVEECIAWANEQEYSE